MTCMSVPAPEKWIVRPRPNPGARLRLFCLPFAGGTASLFRTWPDGLPADVEICAVQLPGRENRLSEPLYNRMTDIVGALDKVVSPLLDKPYVTYGHSMGGLISFELVRQLRRENKPLPLHMVISGRRGPDAPCRFPDLHTLPQADLLKAIRKYGGTPEAVLQEKELMDLLVPIVRADFAVLETYQYREEPPLDVPLTLYQGTDDIRTTDEEIEAWRKQTTRTFTKRKIVGEHFFIQTARDEVLKALTEVLKQTS